jgi:hypothetical protein
MVENVILVGLLILAAGIRLLFGRESTREGSEPVRGPGIRW